MKWFKHDATAAMDAKLKKLRMRYGLEGYGLYWYLLECIARGVEPSNLSYELEEDSEVLAHELNINRDSVEEMMRFMCELRLFEADAGMVTCLKLRDRSDEYTAKLLRSQSRLRTNSGHSPDKVPSIRTEQNRTEEKESKRKRKTPIPKDFQISDNLRTWAKKNGHGKLNQHLGAFIIKAEKQDYRYVDWDKAFMDAIRNNWARVDV